MSRNINLEQDLSNGRSHDFGNGLKQIYAGTSPNPDLDEKVIQRVHALRESETGMRAPLVSRRTLLIGSACAAGAGIALGVAAHLGHKPAQNSFGLAVVANAAETDGTQATPIALSATEAGLMPYQESGMDLQLKLNLAASGANIASVTYSITDSPTEEQTNTVYVGDAPETANDVVRLYSPSADEQSASNKPFTVSYAQKDGTSDFVDADGTQHYITVERTYDYWQSDEVLALLRTWIDEGSSDPSTEQLEGETVEEYVARRNGDIANRQPYLDELYQTYRRAFDEIVATSESLVEWQRKLYVSSFAFSGPRLTEARLQAEVTFADGNAQVRRYRISLVEDYEEVLSARFDALCGLDGGEFEDVLQESLPWHRWPDLTNEQIAADERLSAAIFQIEDVTEK